MTVAFVILLFILCACCNYCILKSAAKWNKKDFITTGTVDPSNVSTIEDWQDFRYRPESDISPRRRTTPKLEQYNIRSVSPSPQRNI